MRERRRGRIICPIATPLTADERLDVDAYLLLLRRLLPDLDGVLVLGSTGEFTLLRDAVARQAVEVTVDEVSGRIPVYVGVGDSGTQRVIDRLDHAAAVGADYVLVCSHFYYGVTDDEALFSHFRAVADASRLPMLLYNIPQNTHVNLSPSLLQHLASHPNIIGIKDSWGDMLQFQEFLSVRDDTFAVYQGREQLAAAALWLGADGIVSALANFAPHWLQKLAAAVAAGDRSEVLALQKRISHLATVFDQGYWISALKMVLAELGIGNGRVARPLPSLSKAQMRQLRRILRQNEFAMVGENNG